MNIFDTGLKSYLEKIKRFKSCSDMSVMRWIKRAIKDPFWFIVTLPFKLLYLFFQWLLSAKFRSNGSYIVKRTKSGILQYEHREIAEEVLGRRLEPWEVVHHINGRRGDNRPSNLCVMSRSNHDRYHEWYDWVHKTYGKYPRRATQLRKLRVSFNGSILSEIKSNATKAG